MLPVALSSLRSLNVDLDLDSFKKTQIMHRDMQDMHGDERTDPILERFESYIRGT